MSIFIQIKNLVQNYGFLLDWPKNLSRSVEKITFLFAHFIKNFVPLPTDY